MTGPAFDPVPANRPARARLGRGAVPPATAVDVEAAEVAQGQAAAVLGALARMQLRVDVLAREQSDMFARVLSRLDQLEAVLATEGRSAEPPYETAAPESAYVSPPQGEEQQPDAPGVNEPSWPTPPGE